MAHQEIKPIVFPEKKKEKPPIVFLSEKPKIVFPDEEPSRFKKIVGGALRDVAQATLEAGADLRDRMPEGRKGGGLVWGDDKGLRWEREKEFTERREEFGRPTFDVVPEPDRTAGSMFRDLLGFSAPFSVGAKAVGGIKGATKLVTALKAMGVGAAAEQVAFSKYEPRLSNLIQSLPKAKKIAVIGPLTEYLQADPEDTSADARLKMALEGSIIGGALETVLWGARAIKASKGKPKTQEVPTEAIEPEKLLEDVADTERGAYSDALRIRAGASETAAYQSAARPVSLKTPTKKAPKKKDYFGNRFEVDPNTGVINAVFKSKKKGDQDFTIVPQEDGTYAVTLKRQLNNDELDKLFSEGAEFNTTTQAGRDAIQTARAAKIDVPFETTFPNRRAAQDAVMDIGSPGRLPKSLRPSKLPDALTNKRISAKSFLRGKGGFDQSEKFQEELWRAFPEPHIQQKFNQYGKTSMAESVPLWARAPKDGGGMRSMSDLTEVFMESEALGHHYKGKGDLSGSKLDEITEDLLYRDQLDVTQAQELENWNRIAEGQEQIIERLESAGHKPKRMSDEQVDIALRKIETDEDTLARRAETEESFTRESERLRATDIEDEIVSGRGPTLRETTEMQRAVPRAVREAQSNLIIEPIDSIGKTTPSTLSDPTKAGNINLKYLDLPPEPKNMMKHIADNNDQFIDARQIVKFGPKGEGLRALAEESGFTVDDLLKRKKGEAFNAAQIESSRQYVVQSALETMELAKIAAIGGKIEKFNFLSSVAHHTALQKQLSGLTAEAGRALRAFKEIGTAKGEHQALLIKDIIDRSGGDTGVEALATAIANVDSVKGVSAITRDMSKPGFLDKLQEMWINGLLSSPSTHGVNVGSNFLVATAIRPAEYSIAAAIGAIRRTPDRITGGEVMARTLGTIYGTLDGLVAGAKAFVDPESAPDVLTKLDLKHHRAIKGLTGDLIRVPVRALVAEDVWFKTIGYRQELWAQAARLAQREGKGIARMNEIMQNPAEFFPDIHVKSIESGRYGTFTNQIEGLADDWAKAVIRHPNLRWMTPFVRTPYNIVTFAAERMPIPGRVKGEWYLNVMKRYRDAIKAGGRERDLAHAKLALGSSIMMGVGSLSRAGYVTGRGPADYRERRLHRQLGILPYSIKVGDTYYGYNRFEPAGIIMGISSDMANIWESLSAEEKIEGMKILAMVTASVSENLTNKTFMVGISNAIEAIGDPDRYAERVLKGFAASFVPTALYYYRKGEDPYMREISSVWDAFMNRLPGYSEQLPLRRNVLGEPMKFPPGLGGRFSPIRMSKIKKDPVYQEFLDIGYFPTTPDKTVRGVKITNKQYSELLEFQQNQLALRANLQFLINQPTWKRMNKFAKKEQLDQVIQGTQKKAEDMLWNKYRDELEEKWRKQKKETYPRVEPLQ